VCARARLRVKVARAVEERGLTKEVPSYRAGIMSTVTFYLLAVAATIVAAGDTSPLQLRDVRGKLSEVNSTSVNKKFANCGKKKKKTTLQYSFSCDCGSFANIIGAHLCASKR
jgi:hypothetical protein